MILSELENWQNSILIHFRISHFWNWILSELLNSELGTVRIGKLAELDTVRIFHNFIIGYCQNYYESERGTVGKLSSGGVISIIPLMFRNF